MVPKSVLYTRIYSVKKCLLDSLSVLSEVFNDKEQELGLDVTDYYELDGLIEDYSSYYRLWDMVINFQEKVEQWQTVPMHTVDAENVESLLDQWSRRALALAVTF